MNMWVAKFRNSKYPVRKEWDVYTDEREVFGSGCMAGFGASVSVPKLNMVSATPSDSVSDTFSWLISIRITSEDVTCGERMGGDNETLTSALEWRVSSECGLIEETEVVFPDFRRCILPVYDVEWPYNPVTKWK